MPISPTLDPKFFGCNMIQHETQKVHGAQKRKARAQEFQIAHHWAYQRSQDVACLCISLQERKLFGDMLEGEGLSLGHKSLWTHIPASQAVKAYVEHWPHGSIKAHGSKWCNDIQQNQKHICILLHAVGRSLNLLVPSKWAVGSMILSHVHVPLLVRPHGLRHLSLVFSLLSVSEMGLYVHIAPLFSRQWLGLLCRVNVLELIDTRAPIHTPGALCHRAPVQTQGVCSHSGRRKLPPLILAPIGSAKDRRAVVRERTLTVGIAMQLVLRRGHVLQICQRIVAPIHILVIDLGVLRSWWRSKKSVRHQTMNALRVRLAWDGHRCYNIPGFATMPQGYDTSCRLDSPKRTHHSAWHSCASSGTDHGFPLFSCKIATSSFSEFSELVFTTISNCISVASLADCLRGNP